MKNRSNTITVFLIALIFSYSVNAENNSATNTTEPNALEVDVPSNMVLPNDLSAIIQSMIKEKEPESEPFYKKLLESFWFDVPTFTHSLLISTILYPNVSASILDTVCFPTPGFPVKTNIQLFKTN